MRQPFYKRLWITQLFIIICNLFKGKSIIEKLQDYCVIEELISRETFVKIMYDNYILTTENPYDLLTHICWYHTIFDNFSQNEIIFQKENKMLEHYVYLLDGHVMEELKFDPEFLTSDQQVIKSICFLLYHNYIKKIGLNSIHINERFNIVEKLIKYHNHELHEIIPFNIEFSDVSKLEKHNLDFIYKDLISDYIFVLNFDALPNKIIFTCKSNESDQSYASKIKCDIEYTKLFDTPQFTNTEEEFDNTFKSIIKNLCIQHYYAIYEQLPLDYPTITFVQPEDTTIKV